VLHCCEILGGSGGPSKDNPQSLFISCNLMPSFEFFHNQLSRLVTETKALSQVDCNHAQAPTCTNSGSFRESLIESNICLALFLVFPQFQLVFPIKSGLPKSPTKTKSPVNTIKVWSVAWMHLVTRTNTLWCVVQVVCNTSRVKFPYVILSHCCNSLHVQDCIFAFAGPHWDRYTFGTSFTAANSHRTTQKVGSEYASRLIVWFSYFCPLSDLQIKIYISLSIALQSLHF